MSKGCRFVILGEDEAHLRFTEKFLIRRGLAQPREVFFCPIPAGRGSGEQHVRDRFPVELTEIRRVAGFQRKFLIVLVDGDGKSMRDRQRELENACRANQVPIPNDNDPVCVAVPQRNIQTWIRFLTGHPVDESTDYKQLVTDEVRKHASVALAETCRKGKLPSGYPTALQVACNQFGRLDIE